MAEPSGSEHAESPVQHPAAADSVTSSQGIAARPEPLETTSVATAATDSVEPIVGVCKPDNDRPDEPPDEQAGEPRATPPDERAPEPSPAPAPKAEAEPETQIVAVPDPEVDALLEKISGVESMLAELVARQADMQQLMQDFQLRQYQALGDCLAEVLRLRHEHAQRVAARSGLAEDQDRARRAAEELAGLNEALSVAHNAPPELDDETRDELKRLYRAVAMRCHPDRVGEADKALAHDRFQQAQLAYRNHDLVGLNALIAEMDRDSGPVARPAAPPPVAELSKRLLAMRNAAADLILAIQTLQLEPDYRRALDRDDWEAYFDRARESFEHECDSLREAIAEL